MKLALCQINPTVGDIDGNTDLVLSAMREARSAGADLAVFPELCITGYPPVDLLLNQAFIRAMEHAVGRIAQASLDIPAVVGAVSVGRDGRPPGNAYEAFLLASRPERVLFNAAFFVSDGRIAGVQEKSFLPNYDVFDETRYFEPAMQRVLFELNGCRFGANICEDIWIDNGPTDEQVRMGAEFIVNISASPFCLNKHNLRFQLIRKRATENRVPVFYVNAVGGQDSLIFDGGSFGIDASGNLIGLARRFEDDLVLVDTERLTPIVGTEYSEPEEICLALKLGIMDYVEKNGFDRTILGLSGGIDSALVACLATAALGKDRVLAMAMPGPFSSPESLEDANMLAQNLGIELKVVGINALFAAYRRMFEAYFIGMPTGVAEQNIQARIRGNILMALSNEFGYLVLSTGNKSEVAVGYNTLYGDLAGGLSVISDVPKTLVYRMARFINEQAEHELIPARIINRAPSAELRANQTDQDDLPPYEILDGILHRYIEENQSAEEIVAAGYEPEVVRDVLSRVDRNEYKRQQAPLGLKITPRAFGFGRRMPITNKWHG